MIIKIIEDTNKREFEKKLNKHLACGWMLHEKMIVQSYHKQGSLSNSITTRYTQLIKEAL